MAPFLLANGFFAFLIPFLIGMGFGFVLEISGFGDSRKLSGQFYLREMTVLKVMFTAIITTMTLLYFSSSMGWVNFEKIYINPTYFASGITGGLIMGVGFIIGGFCPGTSLVGAATLKLDGIFFVLGAFVGVFLFGESVSLFEQFFYGGGIERFTLEEAFGIPVGWIVIGVLLMAFFMFYMGEISEKIFGEKKSWASIDKRITSKYKLAAASFLMLLAVIALLKGQPTTEDKWEWISQEENQKIDNREIYVSVVEFHEAMNNSLLYNVILDMRNEIDYNMFHLESAWHVSPQDLLSKKFILHLKEMPSNTVKMLVSNGEEKATEAYKILRAQGVINVYVLEGGMNQWFKNFPPAVQNASLVAEKTKEEQASYVFKKAYGDSLLQANPHFEHHDENHKKEFEPKIKIETKKVVTGGCG